MPPKGADEGAGFGFPFVGRAVLQGFALRGEFLFHVEKEPKDAGGRLRMSASRSYSPYPQTPITGVTPWVRQKISGAQNLSGGSEFPPGHWALGLQKLRLVQFNFCAWLCRTNVPGTNDAVGAGPRPARPGWFVISS